MTETAALITSDSPIIAELLSGKGANGGLSVTYGRDDTGRELVRVEDGQTRWIGDGAEWRAACAALVGRGLDDLDAYSEACQDTALIVNIHGTGTRNSIEGVARATAADLLDGREVITILGRDGWIGGMSEEESDDIEFAINMERDRAKTAEIVRGLSRFTV